MQKNILTEQELVREEKQKQEEQKQEQPSRFGSAKHQIIGGHTFRIGTAPTFIISKNSMVNLGQSFEGN